MKSNLHCYYRISDKGNPLGRTELGGTFLKVLNRRKCFNNFLEAFGTENLHVVADRCHAETLDFINSKNIDDVVTTSLGNTGSFAYMIARASKELSPNDIFYSVEDDYLHTPDARQYIFEGNEIADYVSLYDSLDKYIDSNKGGNNPLIRGGGEDTKVILGKTIHFKRTNATTGTFSCKVKILWEDFNEIMSACRPEHPHPQDFRLFRHLITVKNRVLVCPIPGKASHVGLELSPFVDWETIVKNLKEE